MSHRTRNTKSGKRSLNGKRKKNRERHGARNMSGLVFISPIKNKPILTRNIRYLFDDQATRINVTTTDLKRIMAAVTTGSIAAIPLIDSLRILRIGLTMLPNSSTGTATTSFTWEGTNAPEERFIMYAAQGIPSKDSYYPPDNTSCGWWINEASAAYDLFSIDVQSITSECPVYVDIEFQYVPADGSKGTFVIPASAITGISYGRLGGNFFTPVDLTTY